jgi:hypothetical protein
LWLDNQKQSFWRSFNYVHIYRSKLNFTPFIGYTSSKVLCTGHFMAAGADALSDEKELAA